jgi:hypothetical protein
MYLRLMLLTVVEVLALVGALVAYVWRIVGGLERTGGTGSSSLAKVSFGVSAIERETSHLAPQVERLNSGLVGLAGRLASVGTQLGTVAAALDEPEGRSR